MDINRKFVKTRSSITIIQMKIANADSAEPQLNFQQFLFSW